VTPLDMPRRTVVGLRPAGAGGEERLRETIALSAVFLAEHLGRFPDPDTTRSPRPRTSSSSR
jgi:hypothetical protein